MQHMYPGQLWPRNSITVCPLGRMNLFLAAYSEGLRSAIRSSQGQVKNGQINNFINSSLKLILMLYLCIYRPKRVSNNSSSVGQYDHTDQLKTNYLKRVLVCKYINITEELTLYYYLSV